MFRCYRCRDGKDSSCKFYKETEDDTKMGGKHNKAYRKHQAGVDKIFFRILAKPYTKFFERNVEYINGEMDVHTIQGRFNREVYYEYKGKHSVRNLEKAVDQCIRWTRLQKAYGDADKDYYGIYVAPKYMKIVAKNGIRR